ncbi:hypothetical protein DFP72DRAFT_812080 [Ephemerocybe angulata]|uniref:Uncharacterized protein n=1 Tax=Ephemerocybe angulata TaxID=980116 RepID=A0A8H6HXV0_9AGAR|nr:hypothetical protein DFP72DRAFT_812080 [Tulosesus angulatus]
MCVQLPCLPFDTVKKRLVVDWSVELNIARYRLAGIVYWGADHFGARIVDDSLRVYRYDGMQSRGSLAFEFSLSSGVHRNTLSVMDRKVASMAVYARM